jgi:hypothetical protein
MKNPSLRSGSFSSGVEFGDDSLPFGPLRRKIEVDPAHPTSIRTVRGAGYMFVPPED